MPVTITPATSPVLPDELLTTIERRADGYDLAGQPSREDLDALREGGYYRAPLAAEHGGLGLTLREAAALHRRIGYRSAPTALAAATHLSWAGAVADRARAGDADVEPLLRALAGGELPNAGRGVAIAPSAAFQDSISAWSAVLTAAAYLGTAQHAFDLAARASADRPGTWSASGLAESVADLDAVEAHVEVAAREWTDRPVADTGWNRRMLSVREHTARTVAGRSLEAIGGRSPHTSPAIERLYRDIAVGTLLSPTPDALRQALASPAHAGLSRTSGDRQ